MALPASKSLKPSRAKSVVSAKTAPAKQKDKTKSNGAANPQPEATHAVPKHKLVRDSFTMPTADFDLIDVLKARALVFQRPAKKSELLRAGLHALAALSDAQLRKGLEALTPLKAGRPKKAAPAPTPSSKAKA